MDPSRMQRIMRELQESKAELEDACDSYTALLNDIIEYLKEDDPGGILIADGARRDLSRVRTYLSEINTAGQEGDRDATKRSKPNED